MTARLITVAVVGACMLALASCPSPIRCEYLLQAKDRTGPVVIISSPDDGSYCAKAVIVAGSAADSSSAAGDAGQVRSLRYEVPSSSVAGEVTFAEDGSFTFQFPTVNLGATFVLRVIAEDWNGNTGEGSITLLLLAGSDIPSFAAEAGNHEATLSWSEVPLATEYTLHYTEDGSLPSSHNGKVVHDVHSPAQVAGLQNGSVHVFRLQAHSSEGEDNWSGYQQVIPLSTLSLAPRVRADRGSLRIEWPQIEATDEFEIWRGTTKTGEYSLLATCVGNEHTDHQAGTSGGFYYRIRPTMPGSVMSEPGYGALCPFPAEDVLGSVGVGSSCYDVVVVGDCAYATAGAAGLVIVDISNPASMSVVKTVDTPGQASGIAVSGSYAYVTDNMLGLRVIDISDPASASVVGNLAMSWAGKSIAVSGPYAYVSARLAGMQIVDVSDPTAPHAHGSYNPGHEVMAVGVSGTLALVADSGQELMIVDVSNPDLPSWLKTVPIGVAPEDVSVEDTYAYVASQAGLEIVDFSVVGSAAVVRTVDTGDNPAWVTVNGSRAYASGGSASLQIVDISSPASATVARNISFAAGAGAVAVSGSTGFVGSGTRLMATRLWDPAGAELIHSVSTGGEPCSVSVSDSYAYVGDGNGALYVVGIADPGSAAVVGTVPLEDAGNVSACSGDCVFLAEGLLAVVGVTTPSSPELLGELEVAGSAVAVAVSGDYACVGVDPRGLSIADVSDPLSPSLLSGAMTTASVGAVAVSGQTAYGADLTSGLVIVDVSDMHAPLVSTTVATPGGARKVAVSGRYAYVVDGAGDLKVIDVSVPSVASIVSTIDTASPLGLAISNGYLYSSDATSGLQIIDISTPAKPFIAATVTGLGIPRDVAVLGAYAYVVDYCGYLHVVRLLGTE